MPWPRTGSEWRSSDDGLVNRVGANLKWKRGTDEKSSTILLSGTLVTTNGLRAVRISVDAGRVQSIEWRRGELAITWVRL